MIQQESMLRIADNYRCEEAHLCIRVLGGFEAAGMRAWATWSSSPIKDAIPNAGVKKGEVAQAVVVRTAKEVRRRDGTRTSDSTTTRRF